MYTSENGEKEPEWVITERKHFYEFRDENKVSKTLISERLLVTLIDI